ncbi:ATP synthase subunit gamma, mitochondrial-like [Leguminivora glycinivorella]|uniref:ATP synthase subunit gamma, mitochondrial-like n=1 Tax=Leguminivora glycinivorella TaxID=1035111 RepID=UPI00200DEEE3|nr:ATP synthase subunit gamma, mitochondrial-like [Leguminivora glycinivorella]
MVQLKQVSLRLKSIKNIQKITKTMKMVSASKFTRAERELRAARPFGYAPRKFYESSKLVEGPVDAKGGDAKKAAADPAVAPAAPPAETEDEKKLKRVYIAVTSDRGLCGGVHSGVARRIRRDLAARSADGANHKIFCIGDKSRGMLRRQFAPNMIVSIKDIGRQTPVFADASRMAAALSDSGYVYDIGNIYYNKFFSAVKYELNTIPFFNKDKVEAAPNMNSFDDVDADQLECYTEFTLAALLYYALKESAASEQSARMSAMDNATKNASEMIRKLTLLFNRTRQSVITRELIEIISGAAALQ